MRLEVREAAADDDAILRYASQLCRSDDETQETVFEEFDRERQMRVAVPWRGRNSLPFGMQYLPDGSHPTCSTMCLRVSIQERPASVSVIR